MKWCRCKNCGVWHRGGYSAKDVSTLDKLSIPSEQLSCESRGGGDETNT